MTTYFTAQTFQFLQDLAENNQREWFNDHKHRYESCVRSPALQLIHDLAEPFAQLVPDFIADDRKRGGSLMRIHRDIRFSANKTPYKTNIGIHFRHSVGKDVHAPGFYLHIDLDECFIGGGIWHPDAATLAKIRTHIDDQQARWQSVVGQHETIFERYRLVGDSLKRAPKGYPLNHPLIKLLKRKDHIAITPIDETVLLGPNLVNTVCEHVRQLNPFVQLLCRAIGVNSGVDHTT